MSDADAESFAHKHPFLIYTALRLLVLLVSGALLYLLGLRGIVLILVAFIISAIASYALFARQRDRVGAQMGGFFGRMNERIEESKRAEDHYFEEEVQHVRDVEAQVEAEAQTHAGTEAQTGTEAQPGTEAQNGTQAQAKARSGKDDADTDQ